MIRTMVKCGEGALVLRDFGEDRVREVMRKPVMCILHHRFGP